MGQDWGGLGWCGVTAKRGVGVGDCKVNGQCTLVDHAMRETRRSETASGMAYSTPMFRMRGVDQSSIAIAR